MTKNETIQLQDGESLMFVYGTLQQGQKNHRFMDGSKYVGTATLANYKLYELGSYPGMVPCQGSIVHGELYIINKTTLQKLDDLEGSEYIRKQGEVVCEGRACVVYYYEFIDTGITYPEFSGTGHWRAN